MRWGSREQSDHERESGSGRGSFRSDPTVGAVLEAFAAGTRRETLVRRQLERIAERSGEGSRAFLKVYETAIAEAAAYDRAAQQGNALPRYAGVTISIKDLFDVAGDVTTSGSVLLKTAAPATRDAEVVARLKSAGFIPVGRTNMTEFAFSGLGINPHYGTPLNPYDRAAGEFPVARRPVPRYPSAMAWRRSLSAPTRAVRAASPQHSAAWSDSSRPRHAFPSDGVMPLSTSLDSIGSIGHSVACCAAVDEVVSGQPFVTSRRCRVCRR